MSQFIFALCKMIMAGKNQCNFQGAIVHFVGTQGLLSSWSLINLTKVTFRAEEFFSCPYITTKRTRSLKEKALEECFRIQQFLALFPEFVRSVAFSEL